MRAAVRSVDARWALGLTALALALRLGLVLSAGRTVTFNTGGSAFAFNDTFFYAWTGAAIAKGDGYSFLGHTTAHWPPGYSVFLAGVFKLFGSTTKNALIANAFLGALTVPLVYAIAHKAAGRTAAILAAAALAVFPGQLLMADVTLSETLYAFELVAFVALVLFLPRNAKTLVLLGIASALAALTRGEGLFFPLIVLAAYGWSRASLKHAAAVTAVMVVAVAPWAIRNADVAHGFVGLAGNSSFTLWSGHNDRADGGPVYQTPQQLAHLSSLTEAKAAAEQRHDAIHYAIHHPGRELELIPLKLRALARGDALLIDTWIDTAGQEPLQGETRSVARTLANVASYGLLVALLVAVALLFRRRRLTAPALRAILVFLALAIPLYGFVYYGNVRYRVPLEPLMLIVAATGAVELARRTRDA